MKTLKVYFENIYGYLLRFGFMWKKVPFDGAYVWLPRFGFTKKMIEEQKQRAKELAESIIWD